MADYFFYQEDPSYVQRRSDGAFVREGNYEYDAWLAAGGVPDPYVPPPPPPEPTPAERLASAGLTIAELKTLLGIA
jgi:hypothetical protein